MLLSDYAKGVLTARVIRNVIDAARKLGKRVIVDPKSANFAIYRGATLLTPNRKEFAEATRSRADTEQSIAEAAQDVMQLADCEAVLVTQSEHGMTLVPRSGDGHSCAGPSGQGARRLGRRRYRRRGARGGAGGGRRLGDRVADGERGGRGRGQQERHRHRRRSAELRRKILPHAFLAAEEKIVATERRTRRAASGLAQAGPADRIHQWLFRYPASRPRQVADGGARRLRPA